jgi:predicted RNase H-like HicB family nuclease
LYVEGKYLATPAPKSLPGLVAQGDTVAETISIAQDVARQILALIREQGGRQ